MSRAQGPPVHRVLCDCTGHTPRNQPACCDCPRFMAGSQTALGAVGEGCWQGGSGSLCPWVTTVHSAPDVDERKISFCIKTSKNPWSFLRMYIFQLQVTTSWGSWNQCIGSQADFYKWSNLNIIETVLGYYTLQWHFPWNLFQYICMFGVTI